VNQRSALVVMATMFALMLPVSAQVEPGQPALFPTAEVDCSLEQLTLTERSAQTLSCTINNPNAYTVEVEITHTVDGSAGQAEDFGIPESENITLQANEEVGHPIRFDPEYGDGVNGDSYDYKIEVAVTDFVLIGDQLVIPNPSQQKTEDDVTITVPLDSDFSVGVFPSTNSASWQKGTPGDAVDEVLDNPSRSAATIHVGPVPEAPHFGIETIVPSGGYDQSSVGYIALVIENQAIDDDDISVEVNTNELESTVKSKSGELRSVLHRVNLDFQQTVGDPILVSSMTASLQAGDPPQQASSILIMVVVLELQSATDEDAAAPISIVVKSANGGTQSAVTLGVDVMVHAPVNEGGLTISGGLGGGSLPPSVLIGSSAAAILLLIVIVTVARRPRKLAAQRNSGSASVGDTSFDFSDLDDLDDLELDDLDDLDDFDQVEDETSSLPQEVIEISSEFDDLEAELGL